MFATFRTLGIWKTLWFNFRYLPFKEACRLPFLLASNTRVISCRRGFCELLGGVKPGLVTIGFNRRNNNALPSSICLDGKLIVRGTGIHAFGAGCMVSVDRDATLDLGDHFGCTGETRISVKKSLVIGNDNLWSYGCVVMDNDGHSIWNENQQLINAPQGIVFGDKVWMGCQCLVLKGAVIPSNVVIAAGSRITKKLQQQNAVISTGGVVLKSGIHWTP